VWQLRQGQAGQTGGGSRQRRSFTSSSQTIRTSLKSSSISKLISCFKTFQKFESLFKLEGYYKYLKVLHRNQLLSVDNFDCLSRDVQRLGKVSGGGLELGVLQPAVSTCFTFTILLPKVGYFWIFYCKRYPKSRHEPLIELESSDIELYSRPRCYR
jgi:hypothetical protein